MGLPENARPLRRAFARLAPREARYVADILRTETTGGVLLLAAAAVALLWANSPWRESYTALLEYEVGPAALHLRLDVAGWAADGLLAVFFFVAGLELKRELVVGDLRDPAKAVLPVVAALAGVVVPALLFLLVTAGDPSARTGWAIPVATDIAFALAVLAVVGSHLPTALRSFLLTLAVVDDLIAITIIAIAYTADLAVVALGLALVPLLAFGALVQAGRTRPALMTRGVRWLLLTPLAVATWALVHASGVHATVAGVLLAFTVPVRGDGERHSLAERFEHAVRPLSAGVAVPVFALTAAGVTLVDGGEGGGMSAALRDPLVPAIAIALVVGKAVGVFGGTWLTVRFTRAELDDNLAWSDLVGVALLSGVGFTVSLLIGELAFGSGSPRDDHVKLAVLIGSALAATLAAAVLARRNRHHRIPARAETGRP